MEMKNRLKDRDFLTLIDFTPEEIEYIIDVSSDLKHKQLMKEPHNQLQGRTIAMIFEKQSTRTRFSFQAAIAHLGMQSFYGVPQTMQLARGEPIKDTARIIDRYCDGLVIRTFGQNIVEEYAENMIRAIVGWDLVVNMAPIGGIDVTGDTPEETDGP